MCRFLTIRRVVFSLVLAVSVAGYWWFALVWPSLSFDAVVRVHFLDVGQGDAILIETPNRRRVLVDAGRDIAVLDALDAILPAQGVFLDAVFMTHPDADHVGGFLPVFSRYSIGSVIQSFFDSQSTVYRRVSAAVSRSGVPVHRISDAYVFDLDGVRFTILWPLSESIHESNATSVALLVSYGEMDVLLTGDLPSSVEDMLITLFPDRLFDIELLKVGHHGSKGSTSLAFLSHVRPNALVYSAGAENRYGHPHAEVLRRVDQYRAAYPGELTFVGETMSGTVSFCLTERVLYLCEVK